MLKISIVESETKCQLILEGKLVAPWTDELKNSWLKAAATLDSRELVIDVRGLTVVGTDGEDLLLALMTQGAKFRGTSVFTKEVLKKLAQRARQNGREE